MKKEYFSIARNGARSAAEVYTQLEEQTDFLAPDCCGGGISPGDVESMLSDGYITLEGEKIIVWING